MLNFVPKCIKCWCVHEEVDGSREEDNKKKKDIETWHLDTDIFYMIFIFNIKITYSTPRLPHHSSLSFLDAFQKPTCVFKKCNYKPLPIMVSNYRYNNMNIYHCLHFSPSFPENTGPYFCPQFKNLKILTLLQIIHNPTCNLPFYCAWTFSNPSSCPLLWLFVLYTLFFFVYPQKISTKLEQELTNSNLLE